jgi:hypothetical protein
MVLRREHQTVGQDRGPLELAELADYLAGIREAARALEAARVPLAAALQRIERGG